MKIQYRLKLLLKIPYMSLAFQSKPRWLKRKKKKKRFVWILIVSFLHFHISYNTLCLETSNCFSDVNKLTLLILNISFPILQMLENVKWDCLISISERVKKILNPILVAYANISEPEYNIGLTIHIILKQMFHWIYGLGWNILLLFPI